jgi:peptidyl-dipeptidase A
MHKNHRRSLAATMVAVMFTGPVLALPAAAGAATAAKAASAKAQARPTVLEAERFIKDAEEKGEQLALDAQRAEWVAQNRQLAVTDASVKP